MLHERPVDLERIERHGHRAGFQLVQQGSLWRPDLCGTGTVICRTPPLSLPPSLPVLEPWRIPEKLLHDIDTLIKGSFEAGHWRFNGNGLIINSSLTTEVQSFRSENLA